MLGMLIGGIVMIFTGISLCFSTAASGILTVGIGCIFMAIGLAGLVFVRIGSGQLVSKISQMVYKFVVTELLSEKERIVRLYEKDFQRSI